MFVILVPEPVKGLTPHFQHRWPERPSEPSAPHTERPLARTCAHSVFAAAPIRIDSFSYTVPSMPFASQTMVFVLLSAALYLSAYVYV